jgi:hypothetical protein
MLMAEDHPMPVWLVWPPGEESPQVHHTRESAAKHADIAARMNIGATIHLYQLKSVGSIKYPNSPLIIGDMIKV